MINALLFLAGMIFGIVLGLLLTLDVRNLDGNFIVDDSDEQKTRWILDMKTEPEKILKKKKLCFKVYLKK